MRIIPVIDILNGVAVHAIKGKRSQYQPLQSVLCNSYNPLDVAKCFDKIGFFELYVADLDSIMKKGLNTSIVEKIFAETDLKVIIDNGIIESQKVKKMLALGASKVIIGTESLSSLNDLRELIGEFGNRLIISLDLMDKQVLSNNDCLSRNVISALRQIENTGVKEIILLDLKRVGSQKGPDFEFLKTAVNHSNSKILVGGGTRKLDDIKKMSEIGIDGVLIATGLHKGNITYREIEETFY